MLVAWQVLCTGLLHFAMIAADAELMLECYGEGMFGKVVGGGGLGWDWGRGWFEGLQIET